MPFLRSSQLLAMAALFASMKLEPCEEFGEALPKFRIDFAIELNM